MCGVILSRKARKLCNNSKLLAPITQHRNWLFHLQISKLIEKVCLQIFWCPPWYRHKSNSNWIFKTKIVPNKQLCLHIYMCPELWKERNYCYGYAARPDVASVIGQKLMYMIRGSFYYWMFTTFSNVKFIGHTPNFSLKFW